MKYLRLLNLNCREASRLTSEGMDRRLSFIERVGLRLHLLICAACRTWRRQVLLIRKAIREQARLTGSGHPSSAKVLPEEARQRIQQAIDSRS